MLKVLPLHQLIDLQRATYMYSFSNNLLPSAFTSYCAKPTHRYQTRYSKTNYTLPKYSSRICETSIKVIGPKLWTDIPTSFKQLPFRKTFSKNLKNFYLSKLPTEKRTEKLNLEDKDKKVGNEPDLYSLSLQEMFNISLEQSFHGFDQ